MRKKCVLLLIVPLVLAGLLSCGLEDLFYIAPVSEDNISMEMSSTATIQLPDSGGEGYNYFSNFVIFYRIYISEYNLTGKIETRDQMTEINQTLYLDWNAIYPSTDITNTNINTNIKSLFDGRRYYTLALENMNLNNVINAASLGKTLEIFFPIVNGERPVLKLNETDYTLYRSNDGGVFAPQPDRFFFNSEDLCDSGKANSTINADVAANSSTQEGERHAYASMYIAAMGNERAVSFYSTPTFIGIFKLPRAN